MELINGKAAWRGVQIRNNLDINPTLALVGCDNYSRRLLGEDKQRMIYPTPYVCPSCGLLRLHIEKAEIPIYQELIEEAKKYDDFADEYERLTGEEFKLTEKWFKAFGRWFKAVLPKRKKKVR